MAEIMPFDTNTKAKTTNTIVFDDGTKEYTVENNYGEKICTIHFRPADLSIKDRYNTLVENFEKIVEPLKTKSEAESDNIEELERVEKELIKRLCEFTGSTDAGKIFEYRSPISPVNGSFFFLVVLRGIMDIIEREISTELKLSAERMGEYLDDLESEEE